jgi:V/A-type H+-transporting ATPase subunit I
LVSDAAQLLAYWGLLLLFIDPRLGWLAVIGVALCLANRLWTARSPMAVLSGLGELLETVLQMLLNTFSFARVGAFALAHSALELAVLAMADAVNTMAAATVIVVLGNLLVILVESIVVSIQTTRLVLFEFFMRFFEGRGRAFEPAPKPPSGTG